MIPVVQRYFERMAHYPEQILSDRIYRNRANLKFCKDHGIRLSGSDLERPRKNVRRDKK